MKPHVAKRSMLVGTALLLAGLAFSGAVAAAAGDAAAGAKKSAYCAYCHGVDGNATHAGTPRLAGQPAANFITKMQQYKSNKQMYHPVMAFLVTGLNDQDVRDLAAYYASQPVTQSQLYKGPPPLQ
jgi:cytochrome c553